MSHNGFYLCGRLGSSQQTRGFYAVIIIYTIYDPKFCSFYDSLELAQPPLVCQISITNTPDLAVKKRHTL
jgi:hypothetical protein